MIKKREMMSNGWLFLVCAVSGLLLGLGVGLGGMWPIWFHMITWR